MKLRGFRVELSEIEQVLMQRTSFQGTVLVCGETLVAFLVADQVDVKHVKEEVAKVLPYYMVPQVIISSSDGNMSSLCFFSSIKRSVLRIFESLSLLCFCIVGRTLRFEFPTLDSKWQSGSYQIEIIVVEERSCRASSARFKHIIGACD